MWGALSASCLIWALEGSELQTAKRRESSIITRVTRLAQLDTRLQYVDNKRLTKGLQIHTGHVYDEEHKNERSTVSPYSSTYREWKQSKTIFLGISLINMEKRGGRLSKAAINGKSVRVAHSTLFLPDVL